MAMAMHFAGCASGIPPEFRRSMKDAQWKPTGAFARLHLSAQEYAGELIAVEPEAFILETNGHVLLLPPQCVERVTLSMFESEKAPIVAWGLLGTVSTLSHGAYFLLTAPIWLFSTAIATGAQAGAGSLLEERLTNPTPEVVRERLRKWARFPQGLPSGYVPSSLSGSKTGLACGQPYEMPDRWFR